QDIYNKGALMLHTLRQLIGDDAFYRSVRLMVYGTENPVPGNYAPRYGTTKEFIDIVDKVTGKDMHWFFNVYLYQAALPDLQVKQEGRTLHLAWSVPGGGPFPLPVEVKVGDRVVTLPMTDGHGDVELPDDTTLYVIDPASKLLRQDAAMDAFRNYVEQQRKARKKGS
ncbi:MAG: M1 family peptidase, partial [Luteibacter jiangsuensis]